MKHHVKSKWNEMGAIECWGRNRHRAENIARSKRIFRQRERAALKRQTAELVAEELSRYKSPRYWEDRLDELFGELQELECADERDYELYEICGFDYDAAFYAKAYRELFALIDEVEYELAMAAA